MSNSNGGGDHSRSSLPSTWAVSEKGAGRDDDDDDDDDDEDCDVLDPPTAAGSKNHQPWEHDHSIRARETTTTKTKSITDGSGAIPLRSRSSSSLPPPSIVAVGPSSSAKSSTIAPQRNNDNDDKDPVNKGTKTDPQTALREMKRGTPGDFVSLASAACGTDTDVTGREKDDSLDTEDLNGEASEMRVTTMMMTKMTTTTKTGRESGSVQHQQQKQQQWKDHGEQPARPTLQKAPLHGSFGANVREEEDESMGSFAAGASSIEGYEKEEKECEEDQYIEPNHERKEVHDDESKEDMDEDNNNDDDDDDDDDDNNNNNNNEDEWDSGGSVSGSVDIGSVGSSSSGSDGEARDRRVRRKRTYRSRLRGGRHVIRGLQREIADITALTSGLRRSNQVLQSQVDALTQLNRERLLWGRTTSPQLPAGENVIMAGGGGGGAAAAAGGGGGEGGRAGISVGCSVSGRGSGDDEGLDP